MRDDPGTLQRDGGTRPAVPAPFRWDGPLLAAELPGAAVRFTGRAGGSSPAPFASLDLARYDGRQDVTANLDTLAGLVGIPVAAWAQNRQVHGTVVRQVRERGELEADGGEADGQVLAIREAAGVVLTADCLPVVVAGAMAVAVLHAGWRGLAGGILEEGVRALRELGAHGPLQAVIGPGAGGCCYEVGPDVRAAFAADGVLSCAGAHRIDLKAIATRRLHAAGVETVHDSTLCTMCATDPATGERLFFSHRADGGTTGRQAGIAWLS
ncbi:MAG: hypothetical protein JWN65_3156 [Solirubrobacterales bacterium]|jgi:YfiH family protein|nr:hypothetical protein [Solirubrobacterales bacterium]